MGNIPNPKRKLNHCQTPVIFPSSSISLPTTGTLALIPRPTTGPNARGPFSLRLSHLFSYPQGRKTMRYSPDQILPVLAQFLLKALDGHTLQIVLQRGAGLCRREFNTNTPSDTLERQLLVSMRYVPFPFLFQKVSDVIFSVL